MYPDFGVKGATYFLGIAEWLFGALLLAEVWNKKLGIFGAIGACALFVSTFTIIPFIPNDWARPRQGGFPAMSETVAFLMKGLVLLAASFYLLRQDLLQVQQTVKHKHELIEARGAA
jgi:uncharacterized membrane protein YkgB